VHHIFGWDEDVQPSARRFLEAVHPADRQRVAAAHEMALAGREPYSFEHRIVRPDGSTRHVHEEAFLELDDDGTPVRLVGVVQDVTERVRVARRLAGIESRRREVLHRLLRACARERTQLATDLHDGPIQMLAVASLRVELAALEPDPPPWAADAVAAIHEVTTTLRDALFGLHPSSAAGGIRDALAQLATTILPEVETSITILGGEPDHATTLAIFGIVQDALWDISARTCLHHVALDVGVDRAGATLTICDDGRPGRDDPSGRVGLLGVQERVEALGGQYELEVARERRILRCTVPGAAGTTSEVATHG